MLTDDIDSREQTFARAAVFDLFDDQAADHFRRWRRLRVFWFWIGLWPHEGHNGDRLRMRFVDIGLHGVFHLRRKIARVAGVPNWFAGCRNGSSHFAKQ